ncbi:MAG: carbohydrate kinase family protein [Chloroflexales bacterium]|nr:carbohydrate kinase family protein [Chloroflexales bacterium]
MARILVAGELNVDIVLSGLPSLPVLGRELLGKDLRVTLGSSSAITAARLALLGAQVDFAGIVGHDDFGQFILRDLAYYGVGTQHIQQVGLSTGATIALTYPHDRALLTYPGTITVFNGDMLTSERLKQYDHLHVGSFFLQTSLQPVLPQVFHRANAMGLTVSLDVGWDPFEQWNANPYLAPTLAYTDFFFPNEVEVDVLAGNNEGDLIQLASKVGILLIVKQGARGASAYTPQGNIVHTPAWSVEVVDTTGAGDAFNAGFLYAYCVQAANLPQALRFATACGSQAVTQVGGATGAPSAAAIEQFLQQYTEAQS